MKTAIRKLKASGASASVPASGVWTMGMASCLLAAACAAPSIGNAPPSVVDECRREVADLTLPDRLPPPADRLPEAPGQETTAIDEARAARAELERDGLASWPEDALLYRCFTSRGVVLTDEQSAVLAEWQERMDETAEDR